MHEFEKEVIDRLARIETRLEGFDDVKKRNRSMWLSWPPSLLAVIVSLYGLYYRG